MLDTINMNKYLQAIIGMGIILIFEAVPFLYKETYSIEDMKWGWIIGFPLVFLIASFFKKGKDQ